MRLSLHKRPRFLPTSWIPRSARPDPDPAREKLRTVRDHLNDSLPPQQAPRSLRGVVIAIALTAATMAFAARQIGGRSDPGDGGALAAAAEQGTRALVDESLHRHLRALQ